MALFRRAHIRGTILAAMALMYATGVAASGPNSAPERSLARRSAARSPPGGPSVIVLQLGGSIQPASRRYLERGLAEAGRRKSALVVVELNTPGGTLVALREMTAAITSATSPVAVYVTPAGAHAASAGFFLLVASDYAAMAPGTNAGAAHPVRLGGSGTSGVEGEKATNDAAALARSLAVQRGRPVKLAEEAVRESRAFSAPEALDAGLINSVPASRAQLLAELDGQTIRRFGGSEQRLALRSAAVEVLPPTAAERVLMKVADPEIAYLLLMLGGAALLIELLHPGFVVPGVVGAIAVLLALYAFSVLPVSFVGATLLVVALALFVAEAFVTSFGVLAIGGLICFLLGSMMLFDTGEQPLRLSLAVVLPVALVIAATILVLVSRVVRARRAPSPTGAAALIGTEGEVVSPFGPSGTVLVHGEYWEAVAPTPLSPGARVRVTGTSGRRLSVESAGATAGEKGATP